MENSKIQHLKTTTNLQTPGILEDTVEGTLGVMTGLVTTKKGGDQDILAVIITEHLTTITTTHQSNNIVDTGSPSTSTDSLMIGGSTGVLDRADTTRNSADTTRITVSTGTENKNRWEENTTIPEIIRIMKGIISTRKPIIYFLTVIYKANG